MEGDHNPWFDLSEHVSPRDGFGGMMQVPWLCADLHL